MPGEAYVNETFGNNDSALSVTSNGHDENVLDDAILTTHGEKSYGAIISGTGSKIIFGNGADITTYGQRSHGAVVSGDGSSIRFGDDAAITTNGDRADGVLIPYGITDASIFFGDNANITANPTVGNGVFANGVNAYVEFGEGANIVANYGALGVGVGHDGAEVRFGNNAYVYAGTVAGGVRAVSIAAGKVTFADNARIVAEGATIAYGVYMSRNTVIKFGNGAAISSNGSLSPAFFISGENAHVTFGNNAAIDTKGEQSHMVRLQGDNSTMVFGDGANITTDGYNAFGAYLLGKNSQVSFGSGANIDTYGNRGWGIYTEGAGSSVSFEDNAAITTHEATAIGVSTRGTDSRITFGNGASITTESNDSYAVYAVGAGTTISFGENASITTGGSSAYGVLANADNSLVTFGNNAAITTGGSNAYGVRANADNSLVTFGNNASITTTGATGLGAYTNHAAAAIQFNGDTKITISGGNSAALYAALGTISSAQSGKYTVSGDMEAVYGTIDLAMTSGSLFTGSTYAGNGIISLNMAGSRWNITDDSLLTTLNLDSTVVDYRGAGLGTVLYADALDAAPGSGGTFIMKTDIVNQLADKLEVMGTMNGSQHNITVFNSGSAATDGSEVVTLVDTADSSGIFQLTGAVDLGAWQYGLRQESGGMGSLWQLYATGASTPAVAGVSTFYASYLLSYADTQTLIQRLGDLRETPHLNGFWFRTHGGKFESNSRSFMQPFDMDYWGVQLGYDRKIENGWDGDLYAGVMFGYSKGDLDYLSSGKGDVDSKTLGVYGTFISRNGFYADLALKYQWMDNDFDVLDSAGTRVTGGKASTNGFGASLEIGRRFFFGKDGGSKEGWYIEPQAQLSWLRQSDGYFTASNGLHIGLDDYTSLLGRIGILAGYKLDRSNFYVTVSKVKEFDGDADIYANGVRIENSFGGDWWVYGLGFTSRLNDRNSVYLDVERASGGPFTQAWAVRAGWRITF